jgi:hypothetical protein
MNFSACGFLQTGRRTPAAVRPIRKPGRFRTHPGRRKQKSGIGEKVQWRGSCGDGISKGRRISGRSRHVLPPPEVAGRKTGRRCGCGRRWCRKKNCRWCIALFAMESFAIGVRRWRDLPMDGRGNNPLQNVMYS